MWHSSYDDSGKKLRFRVETFLLRWTRLLNKFVNLSCGKKSYLKSRNVKKCVDNGGKKIERKVLLSTKTGECYKNFILLPSTWGIFILHWLFLCTSILIPHKKTNMLLKSGSSDCRGFCKCHRVMKIDVVSQNNCQFLEIYENLSLFSSELLKWKLWIMSSLFTRTELDHLRVIEWDILFL